MPPNQSSNNTSPSPCPWSRIYTPPVILSHATWLERQQDDDNDKEDDIEKAEQLLSEQGGAEFHEPACVAAGVAHVPDRQTRDVGRSGHEPLDTCNRTISQLLH